VVLSALGDVSLASGSSTAADNATGSGGSIAIQSVGGNISVASGANVSASGASGGAITLLASAGNDSVSGHLAATGELTLAGSIDVLGQNVAVGSGAVLDASGATGGGQIVVGGLAKSNSLLQSSTTTVDAGAVLNANATASGEGGHVVVFGSSFMRMDGSISAQGGVLGGNGGMIETSGEVISIGDGAIAANARAAGGKAGTWLLDPGAISITATGFNYSAGQTDSSINPASIVTVLDNGTNVTISTGNINPSGAPNGPSDSITVNSAINATAVKDGAILALSAGGDIAISAGITGLSGGSPLTVTLNSNTEGLGGNITIAAPVYLPAGSLNASGGGFTNSNTITASTVSVTATGAAGIANSGLIDASSSSNGVNSGGTVNLSAAAGPVITGSILADSNSGATGSVSITGMGVSLTGPIGVYDIGEGSGGTVQIYSTNGITSTPGVVISAYGGNAGNYGGNGGTVTITNSTGGTTNLSGLNIAANGVAGVGGTGGYGGGGGSVTISSIGLPINLSGVSINVNGGDGLSQPSGPGSAGGDAGTITISGGAISITGGSLLAVGGAGSLGGTGSGIFNGYNGGTGGSGGTIFITADGALSDSGTTIKTQGGAGGVGGNYTGGADGFAQTAGVGGTGGYGGSIQLIGQGGITLTGVNYQTIGGAGGAGGQMTAGSTDSPISLGGNGGSGGDGGSISIQEDSSNISIVNSNFSVLGGTGGAAMESPTHAGFGGTGGDGGSLSAQYAFNLSAAGGITVDSATHITVQGGAGGVGAPGFETSANVSGYSTQAGNGGNGGNVSGILINASGNVSLAGSILVAGGNGGVGGNMFGTNSSQGSGSVAGTGGNGGSVGLSSVALSLTAIGGNLTHTGTISIIGGNGGAGGFGADTFTLAGNGGNGGNVGEVDIYTNQAANVAGTLSILGGAGGGITNTNNPGAPVISGSGGSQTNSLYIEGDQSLNLGGIVNLEVGASGPITGAGTAGGTGTLQTIYLSATGGAITQSAGALVSTSTPLNVNATAGSISLNSPSNSIGILNATAGTGALTVVSMIDMEVQSAFAANSITLVAANGTTGNLTIDNPISTTAGYINLSAGSQVNVSGDLNAPAIYIASGTLTLNGNVTGSNLIDIALSNGALASNGQTLSAPTYVLNAAAGVGTAATPLTLSPPEGSATVVSGGSTRAGFYVTAAGDIAVDSGLAIAAAGGVDLLAGGAVYNLGTISGANVNLSGTAFASNFGVIDTAGTLTMTAPTVVNQGSASAGTINLLATDVDIISGRLVASGDMSISGGALSIGYNGASTNVSAHDISIAVDSLSVSPDISGSGTSSGSGAPRVSISSAGTLTISTTGDATLVAGSEPGSYVSVSSLGNSTYNIGGNLSLTGGSGAHAYVLLDPTAPGTTMTINATNVALTGGSGDGSYAAIQSVKDVIINATSGSIMLTQGAGKDADAVVVAGSGGSITANTPSCINCVQTTGPQPIGDGITEQGFYVATAPPLPAATQPNQTAIDIIISDLITLLNLPLDQGNGDLESTLLVDGTTDGCI
jgi:hypothetical protein